MPGAIRRGGRRTAIPEWRVKAGNAEVFSGTKSACSTFIRERGGKLDGTKLRLIPPNA